MSDINNNADTLDIRSLIERIEELRGERETLVEAVDDARTDLTFASHGDGDTNGQLSETYAEASNALASFDGDEGTELAALESFVAEMKGYGGDHQWEGEWYPVTLVRDSYWKDFAEEEAESLDLIKPDVAWPYNCIDWDKAARELQMDYGSADYDGVTYWYR